MKASDIPVKTPTVWASNAGVDVHTVPIPSQIGITNGAASFTDGFPPLNFLPSASGGVPPFGTDWNGVLQQITGWNQWQQLGGPVPFDSAFTSAIAGLGTTGYPRGASIAGKLGTGNVVPGAFWFSLSDGNTGDPDAGGTGWSQMFALNGTATINVSGNTDVTLTPAQYGYQTIVCTGTLTGNINLILPNNGRWTIENKTAGAFNLTGRTIAVAGFAIPQGYAQAVVADGTTLRQSSMPVMLSGGNVVVPIFVNAPAQATWNNGAAVNLFTIVGDGLYIVSAGWGTSQTGVALILQYGGSGPRIVAQWSQASSGSITFGLSTSTVQVTQNSGSNQTLGNWGYSLIGGVNG